MYFNEVSLNDYSKFSILVEDYVFLNETETPEKSINNIKQEFINHKTDKSWIASKIAWLRSKYSDWMKKAEDEKKTDPEKASVFKKIALKIMHVIDWALKKIQYLSAGVNKGNYKSFLTDKKKTVIKPKNIKQSSIKKDLNNSNNSNEKDDDEEYWNS